MSNPDFVTADPVGSLASALRGAPSSGPTAKPGTNGTATGTSPFRSEEAFDAYCVQVQSRLAEHAAKRAHFLQAAYDRLTRLLQTARAVEDANLYNELWQHRVAARELLESLRGVSPQAGEAAPALPNDSLPGIAPPPKPLPLDNVAFTPSPMPPRSAPALGGGESWSPRPHSEPGYGPPPGPRMPRRPVRPLADIEAAAMSLREELQEWKDQYPLKTASGDLHVPNCLRLRAIACRQRRLEEEAGDTEVAEVTELSKDITGLMEAAGDREYSVSLDREIEPHPTAYQWGELAERYEEMARAEEAFAWWNRHRAVLAAAEVQPLVESIAAIQQRFNRLLFRVGARDPFQQQLFDELRTWAREAQCYLHSLRPKVPMIELVERSATLEPAWQGARDLVEEEDRRKQAIENVVALTSEPDFGTNAERDETRLRAAVLECRALAVPPSDRRTRDALLPWGAMLEGDDRFKEVLREINLEWERRQEAGRPEEVHEEPDAALEALNGQLEAVRELTRDKRCLFLGGTCREETRRKIEEALELRELVWPSTKPSDPLSRFETEIRHSDFVVLLTRFSRKEWKGAQELCERDGKKFVQLPSGYGVTQVVHNIYLQACPEAVKS